METAITKKNSVRVSQVLKILNNAARNDITISQACAEEGISHRTFQRWYVDRKDDIIQTLEILAAARVQEITKLALIRQQGIETLLKRIENAGTETKDVLAILKYVGSEMETALTASGSYDETQEQQAQEYARNLAGPQLQDTENRFVLKRERNEEVIEEVEIIQGDYTDM
jgi:hypothetical protein